MSAPSALRPSQPLPVREAVPESGPSLSSPRPNLRFADQASDRLQACVSPALSGRGGASRTMKTLDSASSLCGARTRSGLPCKRARAPGRPRCRLHGGAPGSGAPFGDRNGRYQTGEYTNQAKAERRWITEVVRAAEGDQMDYSTALVPANLAPSELKPAPKPRPKRVRAKIVQRKGSVQRTYVPIDAPKAWAVALQAALGTSSGHFIDASMRRLMAATMLPGESVPTTNSLSAALALVESMEPENEAQAALAGGFYELAKSDQQRQPGTKRAPARNRSGPSGARVPQCARNLLQAQAGQHSGDQS